MREKSRQGQRASKRILWHTRWLRMAASVYPAQRSDRRQRAESTWLHSADACLLSSVALEKPVIPSRPRTRPSSRLHRMTAIDKIEKGAPVRRQNLIRSFATKRAFPLLPYGFTLFHRKNAEILKSISLQLRNRSRDGNFLQFFWSR